MTERVEYDEFGLSHENAAEYGLPADILPSESTARALASAIAEYYRGA